MDWKDKLFSFDGRIRRRDWWLWGIGLGVVNFIVQMIIGGVIGATAASSATSGDAAAGVGMTAGIASLVVSLLFLWPSAALSIKRAHDRNRPAMFIIGYYALTVLLLVVMTFTMGSALAAAGAGGSPESAGMAAAGAGGLVVGVLGLVLLVYGIWVLIECGFLDGTPGPNRFGPSPKGLGGSAEAFA